jgi:GT2 family glycosyltransferase
MTFPTLGVVVITFNSADVILDCLESLLASAGACLRIVVVDNGSTDGTPALLRAWAAGGVRPAGAALPFALPPVARPLVLHDHVPPVATGPQADPEAGAERSTVTLIDTGLNTGFAGGVNRGLAVLAAVPGIDRFWVLNPDSAVLPKTARAFASHPAPPGGFLFYGVTLNRAEIPERIAYARSRET